MRRKHEEVKGAAKWITTFSDLMNLLLCFFIMLFAMSTIDQEKFQELVQSLSSSFGVLTGGSASIIEGDLVSSGLENLNELSDKYQDMGLNFEGDSSEVTASLNDFKEQQVMEMFSESEEMQDEIEQKLEVQGMIDQVDVEITAQYVQITLSGSKLFDPGSTKVKTEFEPYLNKLGDIISAYDGNLIEVIGHTDNVPLTGNAKYDDNIDLSMARSKTIALFMVENKGVNIDNILFSGKGEFDPLVSNSTAEGRAQNRRVEIRIFNDLSTAQSGE